VGLAACLAVGWMLAISWVALVAHGDVANMDVKFKTGKYYLFIYDTLCKQKLK